MKIYFCSVFYSKKKKVWFEFLVLKTCFTKKVKPQVLHFKIRYSVACKFQIILAFLYVHTNHDMQEFKPYS